MAQENATQWDLRTICPLMNLGDRLFLFLLLAILVVVGLKLLRVFQLSRASRLRRLPDPEIHRDSLEKISTSLKQWLFVPLFAWGLLASSRLYRVCGGLLTTKNIPPSAMLYELRELATQFEVALIVSLSAFLARWYILKRLEKLGF